MDAPTVMTYVLLAVNWLMWPLFGCLIGMQVGPHLAGPSLARHYVEDIPTTRALKQKRIVIRGRYLDRRVSINDVYMYLQTSLRGWDFLNNTKDALYTYCHDYAVEEHDERERDSGVATSAHGGYVMGLTSLTDLHERSNDAAHAVLHWLLHMPDWDPLTTFLRAGVSPTELRDYVDGRGGLTFADARFMAALRTPAGDGTNDTEQEPP